MSNFANIINRESYVFLADIPSGIFCNDCEAIAVLAFVVRVVTQGDVTRAAVNREMISIISIAF